MKYTAWLFRDFPTFEVGFRGGYKLHPFKNQKQGILELKQEISLRGGKYGGYLYRGTKPPICFDCKGDPCEMPTTYNLI